MSAHQGTGHTVQVSTLPTQHPPPLCRHACTVPLHRLHVPLSPCWSLVLRLSPLGSGGCPECVRTRTPLSWPACGVWRTRPGPEGPCLDGSERTVGVGSAHNSKAAGPGGCNKGSHVSSLLPLCQGKGGWTSSSEVPSPNCLRARAQGGGPRPLPCPPPHCLPELGGAWCRVLGPLPPNLFPALRPGS